MSDADKVRAAADYVERTGLHKGSGAAVDASEVPDWPTVVERGVPCCTAGALWAHLGERSVIDYDMARFMGFRGPPELFEWNDAPERTAEEVVAALRAFADSLDAAP